MLLLIFSPLLFAITLFFNSTRVRNTVTYFYVLFLVYLTIQSFFTNTITTINLSHSIHTLFLYTDFILLGYFIYQGFKKHSFLVVALAILQLVLFILFLQIDTELSSYDILVDKVSSYMLLVINIIGGIIVLYSLKYIQSEDFKECKKNLFIAILFFFIAVMNLLVTTNNIEIFFFAFELTTLCSYLLIRYRGDDIAITNSLRALWMNQIGGVAILFSLILSAYHYETIYFDTLLANIDDGFLIVLSFLIIAAFVKGASIPFDKWLLGAMVAPTPVSAILHSATMVKIAPYLILKITPFFTPFLSLSVILFGSFIFFAASLMALSKDFFKEILGLSTIALLALMMAVAAIGTPEAIDICLILIVFHALSKALLFFQAGILEKVYHLKYLSDINHLQSKSKLVVFFILFGFATLTLPPFGAFIGKFATIELLASKINENVFYLVPLIFILLGSVILTLLYFKVVTKLLISTTNNDNDSNKEIPNETIPLPYILTSFSLVSLLLFGVYISYIYNFLNATQIAIPLSILAFTFILLRYSTFKYAKKVKEYNCGEKDTIDLSAYYFEVNDKYKKIIFFVSILLILVLFGVVL
jgi:ech hydrogenase subunit A